MEAGIRAENWHHGEKNWNGPKRKWRAIERAK
jgi:hypothetical protein